MQLYGMSEKEMTSAELFEDFHERMGLRNKISNALVAISLYKANSSSKNLSRYIEDGLGIAEECVNILDALSEGSASLKYRSYLSKVIIDLLTERLLQSTDNEKLKKYQQKFKYVKDVFKTMKMSQFLSEEKARFAEQAMKDIDAEIELAYAGEENLYRGSFVPR